MANTSILAAFERMWQHVVAVVGSKSDLDHTHDDRYYTETEVDTKLDTVNTSISNITSGSVAVAKAEEATRAISADTATSATSATKATQDGNGKVISSTYETKADASAKLTEAKTYADTIASGKADNTHNHDTAYDAKGSASDALDTAKDYTDTKTANLASTSTVDTKISTHNTSTSAHSDIRDLITGLTTRLNTLADSDDTTLDQMSEIVEYIKANKSLIDSITTSKVNVSDIVNNLTTNVTNKPLSAAQGVAIKSLIDALQTELDSHTHAIADVSGLQSALDGKAASSHGTHVSFDSTNKPKMDGTAAFGTSTKVARADHVHPTDTSRASQADLDALETVVAGKVDSLSDLGITATATELNYVDGVTSNIQTQLDAKAASSHSHTITASASDDDVIVLTGTNGTNKVTYSASHANSGVTAGTYKSVTVNAKGHVTGGSNPTTLSGYGITDAYTKTQVDSTVSSLNTAISGKAASSHSHAISDVTNLQSSLDGKASSNHTHNYAGSSSAGGAATSANKVNSSLTVKLNGGTTEGTNMFTFNGSAAKAVNITPSAIGAAASSHTHDDRYYTETEVDTKLSGKANSSHGNHVPTTQTANNATFLRNDNTWQKVTPANIGAAPSGNYLEVDKPIQLGNIMYESEDTHILKLGYWECSSAFDNLVVMFTSAFWGNQHGSSDIISLRQDLNDNSTGSVRCTLQRLKLMNSERVFYYKIDNTNKRVYLYVYVTGGNSYGTWNTTILQSKGIGWVSEYAANQTRDSSFVTISEAKPESASKADTATSATKATQDASGNTITSTYATKTELNTAKTNLQASIDGKAASSHSHSNASTSAAGFMTAAMVTKLNGIATGANAYTLPTASSSTLGGVKTGSNITNSSGTISLTKANVTAALGYTPPTTNTTYSNATQSAAGLMSADDKTQIDYGGIPIVTTAGTGSAYTATIDGITSLKVGTKITIIPHVVSAANAPTLNVNSLGAKAIRMPVSYSSSTTTNGATTTWLAANKPVTLEYNGTYWLTIGLTRPSANYLSGTVPVANGGTGGTTAAEAKTNLGFLTSSDFTVSNGVLILNFL